MKIRPILIATALAAASILPAQAASLLTENFNDITLLAGNGWAFTNNSSPVGNTGWFQGTDALSAQSGPPTSYIAANFDNADFGGNVSNWLILPSFTFNNGDTLSFFTEGASLASDDLEVRFSSNGASTNVGATSSSVGDFTNLLLDVNPTLAAYPLAWTQYTVTLSGLSGATTGRFAFRYKVTDTSANGDFIGIDTVSVDSASVATPEPSSVAMFLGGLVLVALSRQDRKEKI